MPEFWILNDSSQISDKKVEYLYMREKVLGLPVDILTREETFGVIGDWLKVGIKKPKIIVTAYSEFYVNALKDKSFAKIIKEADLVTPDGKSVLAAVEYAKKSKNKNLVGCLLEGLRVGGKILNGTIGESVTGVWLFEKITKNAEKKNWKIFLLGGEHNSSERATKILLEWFPDLNVTFDEGEYPLGLSKEINKQVVEKINKVKPDFLFVTYPAIQQYKWIWDNLGDLKVGVAMGIGGTLDEFVGDLKLPPIWMQKMGLKWLWRLWLQPKRWRRMVDAVIVFPWLVFRESLEG